MTPQEEQAVPESGKAITKYTAQDAHEVGLPSPAAVNYMFSIAKMLYSSALVGKDMGLSKDQVARLQSFGITGEELEKRDREAVAANAMAKMLLGFELQIEPMASLMELSIVKSKVFIGYPRLHKLLEAKGYTIHEMERSAEMAAIKLVHKDGRPDRIFEFTIDDAKRAGLTKRGGYNGDSPSQYELRPRVMLWSRVISEAYRGTGGKGSVYTPEEKQEILSSEPPEDSQEPSGQQFKVGRKSAKKDSVAPDMQPDKADAEAGTAGVHDAPEGAPKAKSEPPQSGSVQTPDKTPSETTTEKPQPTPINTAKVSNTAKVQAETVPALLAKVTLNIPETKAIDYLRGFLNVTKLPRTMHPDIQPALAFLAGTDPAAILRDPHAAGVEAGNGYRALGKFMIGWNTDTRDLAWNIALDRFASTGGGDLREYLSGDPIFVENMGLVDVHAFLRVLLRVAGRYDLATRIREALPDLGQLASTVAQWTEAGMDLNTCTADDIESALLLLAPAPLSSPEDAIAHAHDEENENLFDRMREGK